MNRVQQSSTKLESTEKGPGIEASPALLGKYEYLQQIDSGAQGIVYKARDLNTGRLVAIKQLRIDQVENWKAYDLFEREAKVLSQLDIPGVAKFYEAKSCLDEEPPYAYIVQELIEGVSLESHIRSGQRWTLARTFDIALQVLDILEKLHHSDPPVIHRDLKPGNILVCHRGGKGQVYLIDFGAVANPIVQSGGSTVAGTFGFMPPEQLMGKPGPESDIYSLAATIVYMLTGVSPADIDTLEFRLVIEPHLQAFPAAVMHVLGRMLEPSAKERLTDYEEIRRYFNNFVHSDFSEDSQNTNSINSSADFVSQFKSIRTLWDHGNLRLWSALPSEVPRAVPNELMKIKDVDLHSRRSIVRIIQYRGNVIAILMIVIMVPIWLLGMRLCIGNSGNLMAEYGSFLGILGTIGSILLFNLLYCWPLWFWLFACIEIKSNLQFEKHTPTDKQILEYRKNLFEYGLKTIATVVNTYYLPTRGEPGEKYIYKNHTDSDDNHIYIHAIPSFVITYKFNPPDDSDRNDLIHQITIHRAPEGHLNPGDPLPILYQIDPKDKRKVYSMPFPFAMCDVEDYSDMICYTLDGEIRHISEEEPG